jgi:hypothetical protein
MSKEITNEYRNNGKENNERRCGTVTVEMKKAISDAPTK